MTKLSVPASATAAGRVERDLEVLSSADPVNALSGLLYDWLRDEAWIAAALRIPSTERRAWLAQVGAAAFDQDRGGYASYLRRSITGLDYIWSAEELDGIFRRHTQWLLVNLSDVLDFRYGAPDMPWDEVTILGGEHLREALAAGRGVMVLSAHQSHPGFGFFHPTWAELGISTVANLGDRNAPHSSMLLDGLRDRVELLPTTAAAVRPMLARLSGGGCVAIYGDFLYPGTPGAISALLGGTVLVSSGAVSVALRTGAAVIPLSVARNWPPEGGGVQVRISAPLPLGNFDPRAPESHANAALFFGLAIEGLIRRDPSVWRLWASLRYRWRCGEKASESIES